MDLQLREGLFHCCSGARAIFLDSATNRYFALPPQLERAFQKIRNKVSLIDHELQFAETLISCGVLSHAPSSVSVNWPQPIPPPIGDLPRFGIARPTASLILRAVYARLWARGFVNRNGIGGLRRAFDRLSNQGPSLRSEGVDPRLAQLRSAFEIVDKLSSPRDQCLPRSLAMHRLAKRGGAKTQIILGVRTEPFAAHCWVEFEQQVVSGDFEQARLFTPIMRIE